MPANLGAAEILVILVVALIVLGPKRLPEAGRQVGKALAEVRRWSRGIQNEIKDAFDVVEEPPMVSTDQVAAEAAKVEAARPEVTAPAHPSETAQPDAGGDDAEAGPDRTAPVATEPGIPGAAPTSPEPPQDVVEPPVRHNGSGPPDEAPRQ